jgi:hypothetical protein
LRYRRRYRQPVIFNANFWFGNDRDEHQKSRMVVTPVISRWKERGSSPTGREPTGYFHERKRSVFSFGAVVHTFNSSCVPFACPAADWRE